MKEQLSAFIDSEASEIEERRVLKVLASDRALRDTWERYQVMRAAIRRELDGVFLPGLADRLAPKIQNIPPAHAPSLMRQITPTNAVRAVGATAIAASVAVFAIIGLQTLNQPTEGTAAQLAANKTSSGEYIRAATTRWDTNQPELEDALNVYLVEHNEFAPTGMNSMLPYVRVVIYDSNQ